MGGVLERGGVSIGGAIVHESAEESKCIRLTESRRVDAVRELHFERGRLVMKLGDGEIEVGFQQPQHLGRRQPLAQRFAWITQQSLEPSARCVAWTQTLVHKNHV